MAAPGRTLPGIHSTGPDGQSDARDADQRSGQQDERPSPPAKDRHGKQQRETRPEIIADGDGDDLNSGLGQPHGRIQQDGIGNHQPAAAVQVPWGGVPQSRDKLAPQGQARAADQSGRHIHRGRAGKGAKLFGHAPRASDRRAPQDDGQQSPACRGVRGVLDRPMPNFHPSVPGFVVAWLSRAVGIPRGLRTQLHGSGEPCYNDSGWRRWLDSRYAARISCAATLSKRALRRLRVILASSRDCSASTDV